MQDIDSSELRSLKVCPRKEMKVCKLHYNVVRTGFMKSHQMYMAVRALLSIR